MARPTGIIRYMDDLGRIVIPKEIRRMVFGTSEATGQPMEFYVEQGRIIIVPYKPGKRSAYKDRLNDKV